MAPILEIFYRVTSAVGIMSLGAAGYWALRDTSGQWGSPWLIGLYAGLFILFPSLAHAIVRSDEKPKSICAVSYFMVVGLISAGLFCCIWLPEWRMNPDRGVFIKASLGAMMIGIAGFPLQLIPTRRDLFGFGALGIAILVLASIWH
ncbi:MAG: hypothetical protein JRC77_00510 [Deltaproteobacteria bacterium]|nr:hypothetical protein [Deltaproteobacteria bacterium]